MAAKPSTNKGFLEKSVFSPSLLGVRRLGSSSTENSRGGHFPVHGEKCAHRITVFLYGRTRRPSTVGQSVDQEDAIDDLLPPR